MRRLFSAIVLLCLSLSGMAQEELGPAPAKLLSRIPFIHLSGGIVVIRAQIDSFPDSLNFVFDTGSGGISLDSATLDYLKLPKTPSDKTIRGIGGFRPVEYAKDHALHFPGLTVEHLDFHVNDYDLLTSVYGLKIDGVIGYSFLSRYIAYLDYDNFEIAIYSPGAFKYPKGGYLLNPNFSTLALQTATINDDHPVASRFIFDTGAGLSFLLSNDFAEDSSIFRKRRKFYPTQAEGLGGKRNMSLTVAKEVKLGPYKFKKVPVHVFDDSYNVTNYPLLGGLIGNDILRRFNVVLNYQQQSIYIKPNTHFSDAFDYSYTGLGIYLLDGEIRIIDVVKGSPGDKAGFLPGDVIFSVESNATKNIRAYKNIFQNSLGKTHIVIFRDQKPRILVMDVKDIRK